MFEPVKRFKEKLLSGHLGVGCSITLTEPMVSEVLAPCTDFLWVDTEHSHLNAEHVVLHLLAARAHEVPVFVRVPDADVASIKPILDIGVHGIVVPQMQSAAEARHVVETCRYAPLGKRGLGPRRASDFGKIELDEYLKAANEHLFVSVQVETANALAEIDEIVSIEGLDSVVIGPVDLAHSLTHMTDIQHPKVVEAMQTIVDKTRAAGKFVGMGMGGDEAQARNAARIGVHWVQCGEDHQFMYDAATELYGQIRGLQTDGT